VGLESRGIEHEQISINSEWNRDLAGSGENSLGEKNEIGDVDKGRTIIRMLKGG